MPTGADTAILNWKYPLSHSVPVPPQTQSCYTPAPSCRGCDRTQQMQGNAAVEMNSPLPFLHMRPLLLNPLACLSALTQPQSSGSQSSARPRGVLPTQLVQPPLLSIPLSSPLLPPFVPFHLDLSLSFLNLYFFPCAESFPAWWHLPCQYYNKLEGRSDLYNHPCVSGLSSHGQHTELESRSLSSSCPWHPAQPQASSTAWSQPCWSHHKGLLDVTAQGELLHLSSAVVSRCL